jgi:hypothetical protein
VSGQRHGRQAGFALGQQEDRQEPGRQRQFGVGEKGSGSQRGLVVATMALDQLAGVELAMAVMAAFRALEAVRSAQLEQRLPAGALGTVLFQESGQIVSFLELHHISSHIVILCFSDGYDVTPGPSQ